MSREKYHNMVNHQHTHKRQEASKGFQCMACLDSQATGGATWQLQSGLETDPTNGSMAPKSDCMNAPIQKPQHSHSSFNSLN